MITIDIGGTTYYFQVIAQVSLDDKKNVITIKGDPFISNEDKFCYRVIEIPFEYAELAEIKFLEIKLQIQKQI